MGCVSIVDMESLRNRNAPCGSCRVGGWTHNETILLSHVRSVRRADAPWQRVTRCETSRRCARSTRHAAARCDVTPMNNAAPAECRDALLSFTCIPKSRNVTPYESLTNSTPFQHFSRTLLQHTPVTNSSISFPSVHTRVPNSYVVLLNDVREINMSGKQTQRRDIAAIETMRFNVCLATYSYLYATAPGIRTATRFTFFFI